VGLRLTLGAAATLSVTETKADTLISSDKIKLKRTDQNVEEPAQVLESRVIISIKSIPVMLGRLYRRATDRGNYLDYGDHKN
jgi:hypothetical protein